MKSYRLILLIIACMFSSYGTANDLDDGIAIDENLDDTLQRDFNTQFVVTKSIGRAAAREKRGDDGKTIILRDGSGVGNIDIGAGSDLKGATIINLSNNKESTAISK